MRVTSGWVATFRDAEACIPAVLICAASSHRAVMVHTSFAVVTVTVARTVVISSTAPKAIIGYTIIDIGIVIVPQSTAASLHSHIHFVSWSVFTFALCRQQEAAQTKEKHHCSCAIHFLSAPGNQAAKKTVTLVCNVLTKVMWAGNSKTCRIPCITSESLCKLLLGMLPERS